MPASADTDQGFVAGLRQRAPILDHTLGTAKTYATEGRDRDAAAITYFGFLSVFPLLALGIAVLGFVARDSVVVRAEVLDAVGDVIPGAASFLQRSMTTVTERAGAIGVAGLVALAYSGSRAVDVLRGSLDRVFGVDKLRGWRGKLRNLRFMLVSGVLLAAGVALSTLAAGGVNALMLEVGITGTVSRAIGTIIAVALAFAVDLALFVVLFVRLPNHDLAWRDVRAGALVAASGFLVLKTGGGWIVSTLAARSSAASGIAVGVFGLLITINLAARITLFGAQWAATGLEP